MLYEKVKAYCLLTGTSVMALEKKAGLPNGTIGQWKKATSRPSVNSVMKVADVMGTTVDKLMKNEPIVKR